ncbi:hypothetical protein Q9L58_008530 [Maublancomyces gigas]|uniref:Peptidase metallopeptidase domain-containing protein n=1 Tax=Discina gigas TaxID=1032678 RepID=A0ABR3G9I2_9PEZI
MTTETSNRPAFCTFKHNGNPHRIFPVPRKAVNASKFTNSYKSTVSNPLTIGISPQRTFDPIPLGGQPNIVALEVKVEFAAGTTQAKQDQVMGYAALWSEHAFVDFTTVGNGPVRITVAFDPQDGNSTILLGGIAIVNIGALANPTNNELRRDVLHEFGHALGLMHEHQNPNSNFQWDEQAVKDWYQVNEPIMDEATVILNILTPVANAAVATAADPDSIMAYHIPLELTVNGTSSAPNMVLSDGDKQAIRLLYLGRP